MKLEMLGKLKTIRGRSRNFIEFFRKLKFLTSKKFNIDIYIISTRFWNITNLAIKSKELSTTMIYIAVLNCCLNEMFDGFQIKFKIQKISKYYWKHHGKGKLWKFVWKGRNLWQPWYRSIYKQQWTTKMSWKSKKKNICCDFSFNPQ